MVFVESVVIGGYVYQERLQGLSAGSTWSVITAPSAAVQGTFDPSRAVQASRLHR